MRFHYRLQTDDLRAIVEARGLRRRFGQPPAFLWYGLALANVAFAVARIALSEPTDPLAGWVHWMLAAFFAACPFLYALYFRRWLAREPANGHDVVADFTDREIVACFADTETRIPYRNVVRVDERPEHVLFWLGSRQAAVLPKRARGEGGDWRDAMRLVESRRALVPVEPESMAADGAQQAAAAGRIPWVRRGAGDRVFEKTIVPSFRDQKLVDFPDGRVLSPTSWIGFFSLVAIGTGTYHAYAPFEAGDIGQAARRFAIWTGAGIALAVALFLLLRFLAERFFRFAMRYEGTIETAVHLRFDERGVESDRGGVVQSVRWHDLLEVERGEDRYLFWPNVVQCVWIRFDSFADDAERADFEDAVTRWFGHPPRHPARIAKDRIPPPPPSAADPAAS